jgi:hypothetical protein
LGHVERMGYARVAKKLFKVVQNAEEKWEDPE